MPYLLVMRKYKRPLETIFIRQTWDCSVHTSYAVLEYDDSTWKLGNVHSKLQNVPCSRAAACDVAQLYTCVCVCVCAHVCWVGGGCWTVTGRHTPHIAVQDQGSLHQKNLSRGSECSLPITWPDETTLHCPQHLIVIHLLWKV